MNVQSIGDHSFYNPVDFYKWQVGVEADRLLLYVASIFFCSLMQLVEFLLGFPGRLEFDWFVTISAEFQQIPLMPSEISRINIDV